MVLSIEYCLLVMGGFNDLVSSLSIQSLKAKTINLNCTEYLFH